jgi:predicted permease
MLAHIRVEADRLIEEGVPQAEAMARARTRFGERPEISPARGPRRSWVDLVAADMRYALRSLRGEPVSTATIVVSLVVGIGVNTAIFSLADQVLLRPLPVPEPDRLVQLHWEGQWIGEGRGWGSVLPHPLYEGVRESQSMFSSVAARSPGEVTLVTHAGSERADVTLVTGAFFETMAITPRLGRFVDDSDERVLGQGAVMVLSHAYWASRFGADPDVVGRQITMNGRPMTIVGVAPDGFYGTDWSVVPVAWIPMSMNPVVHAWGRLDQPRVRFQHVYARLAPGAEREEAETALQPWFSRYLDLDMERPNWPGDRDPSEIRAYLASRLAVVPGGHGQAARSEALTEPVLILTAATALLLLLACLNVANLSLARAVTRTRDTAVRTALGASRARIVSESLVESTLLAVAGGALGVAVAPAVGRWILRYLEVGGRGMALATGIEGRTLAVAAIVAVVATLLSGAGPALYASSARPMDALRTRTAGGGLGARRALVVAQVALALVLLTGAGLFGTTLTTLKSNGPGFVTDRLITFGVHPGNDGYAPLEAKRVLEEVLREVRGIPGVEGAGLAAWPLLGGSGWNNNMLVEADEPFVTDVALPMNGVTPGFFALLGVELRAGRDFDARDRADGDASRLDAAIVSRSFVVRWLPDRNPLGVRIDFGRDPSVAAHMEIVGVVDDYAEHQLCEPRPQVYFPFDAPLRAGGYFYLRARSTEAAISQAVRAGVAKVDPLLTIADFRTLDEQIDRLLVFERMLSSLGAAFALVGTFLAVIGLYGVLSFAAEARTREVGIRMALGAPRRAASRLIVDDALRLVGLGVVIALPSIWLLGGLIRSRLYGVSAMDPRSLGLATALLVGVCLLASALPARRISRTDPLEALRVE